MRHLAAAVLLSSAFASAANAGVFLQYGGTIRAYNGPPYIGVATLSGKLTQDVALGQERFVTASDFEFLEITIRLMRANIPNTLFPTYRFTKADLVGFSGTVTGWQETNAVFTSDYGIWLDVSLSTSLKDPLFNDAYLKAPVRIQGAQGWFRYSGQNGERLADSRMSFVPEPASWSMMLAGFWLVGGMLRAASRKMGSYRPRYS